MILTPKSCNLFNCSSRTFFKPIILLICIIPVFAVAQPIITGFSPSSGPVGTTVTINGNNFDPNPSGNIVYFGTVKAKVLTASLSVLTVTVPAGASYRPLTVTTNTLTAYSRTPFRITVPGIDTAFVSSSFAPGKDITIKEATASINIYLGDFDGDGRPDVFYPAERAAAIIRNTSTPGSVSFGSEVDYYFGYYDRGGTVADFDGDGLLDFVCNSSIDNTAHVFKNTSSIGSISFTPALTLATLSSPIAAAATDLDGDGRTDLIVGDWSSQTIDIYRNTSMNGAISFADSLEFATLSTPSSITYGDIDGDGHVDIVISYEYGVSIFRNTSTNGHISFAPRMDYPTGQNARTVVAADLDNDGKLDLAVTNSYSTPTTLSILRNTSSVGSISFAPQIDYSSPYQPMGLVAEDLNSDGMIDLVTSNPNDGHVCVYKNNSSPGQISFSNYVAYSMGAPFGFAMADMDGDGRSDIVAGNSGQTFSIALNTTNQPAITKFIPDTVAPGATLTISGFNLSSTTSVSFGGTAADSFHIVSPTTVSAKIGSGSSGAICITTSYGTTSIPGLVVLPPPQVYFTNLYVASPTSSISIFGDNFIGVRSVTINGVPVSSFKTLNTSQIQAVIASHTTSGFLVVETPTGKDSISLKISQPPLITAISPIMSPMGRSVVISGANFSSSSGSTIVSFGAVNGTTTQTTDSSITVLAPSGATYQPISVLANGLWGFSLNSFIPTFPGAGSSFVPNSFKSTPVIASGAAPSAITISDLDGDGKPDLIYSTPNFIRWRKNMTLLDSISFSNENSYYSQGIQKNIIAQDLDGDGKQDLVATNSNSQLINLFQNTSTSSALSMRSVSYLGYGAAGAFTAAAIGDIDGDGKPDIVVGNPNSNLLSIYRNTSTQGTITFDPNTVNFGLTWTPYTISIADIDQDGKPDIIVGDANNQNFTIFRNNSSPDSFALAVMQNFFVIAPVTQISVGDLDNDGKPDLAMINHFANSSTSTISIFKNTSSPESESSPSRLTLSNPIEYTIVDSITSLQIADLDGDGKPDISFLRPGDSSISVLKNTTSNGTISFADRVDYSAGAISAASVLGDLDGDGRPEMSMANSGTSSIAILQNQVGVPMVTPSGIDPVSGNIVKTTFIDSTVQIFNNEAYVQRHFDVEPQDNPTGSTATITLYFFQSDFDNYNAYPGHGLDLPKNPTDQLGIAALRILQYHGLSATGNPASYSGPQITIDPIDSNIHWNSIAQWWEIKFDITGFSGFFVSSGPTLPLPLTLLDFKGRAEDENTSLQWSTANEINIRNYIIQRSINGTAFISIDSLTAKNKTSSTSNYEYIDTKGNYPTSYYRLKMQDIDGKFTYSNVVVIAHKTNSRLKISPNPAKTFARIDYPVSGTAIIQLFAIDGQQVLIKQLPNGSSTTTIDISNLAQGIYKVIWSNGLQKFQETLIVQ